MDRKYLLMRVLLLWLYNAGALLAIAYVVPGVRVEGFVAALVGALLLSVVNSLLRPLLLILTLPATVLSFGAFIFIINGLLFWLVGSMLKGFEVAGFWAGVLGALLYSLSSLPPMLFMRGRNGQQQNNKQPNQNAEQGFQYTQQQDTRPQNNNSPRNHSRAPVTIDHDPN